MAVDANSESVLKSELQATVANGVLGLSRCVLVGVAKLRRICTGSTRRTAEAKVDVVPQAELLVRVVREVERREAELYRLALCNFEVLVDAQVRVEERGSRDGGPNERTIHAPDRGLREAIGVEILT